MLLPPAVVAAVARWLLQRQHLQSRQQLQRQPQRQLVLPLRDCGKAITTVQMRLVALAILLVWMHLAMPAAGVVGAGSEVRETAAPPLRLPLPQRHRQRRRTELRCPRRRCPLSAVRSTVVALRALWLLLSLPPVELLLRCRSRQALRRRARALRQRIIMMMPSCCTHTRRLTGQYPPLPQRGFRC